ncbi:MAG: hypothetical protein GY798_09655 [Hyphomicrobiales bacterium]|nr:hypothetical protein [Hyphomicrobiales bacterium]
MFRATLVASGLVIMTAGFAAADQVSQADNFDQFTEQFCAAGLDEQHIFIVPASVFSESAVSCEAGESMIRTSEPADDPGHMVLNIDPPKGSESGLDCDGKADVGMTMVAVNCLPASMEATDHAK